MTRSSDIQKEIARLMRDPNALRSGREALQPSGGHDHYDPNQPRVPAGDPRGGQWMSGGSRGGASDREARVRLGSLDAAQLAQVGQGSPRDAQAQPFEGQLGNIGAGQHLSSQSAFEQIDIDRQRRRDERYNFQPDGTDSCRRDPTRGNQSPAARGGLSRQPPMLMTTSQARMPQFRQLLRVQS
jgi:hypothetical protein